MPSKINAIKNGLDTCRHIKLFSFMMIFAATNSLLFQNCTRLNPVEFSLTTANKVDLQGNVPLRNQASTPSFSTQSGTASCPEHDHPVRSGKDFRCDPDSWTFTGNAVGGPVFCSDRYSEPRYDDPQFSNSTGALIGFKCNPLTEAHKEYGGEANCIEKDHPAGSQTNYYCDSWDFRGTAQNGPVFCSDGPEKYTDPIFSQKTGQIIGFKCFRPKVLLLIDSQTNSNLLLETPVWVHDIWSENRFNPKLIVGDWTTKAEVNAILLANKLNLEGAIAVGNVPVPQMDGIWVSQISPTAVSDSDRITLLKSYFRKNHRVRTGEVKFSGLSFVQGSADLAADGQNIAMAVVRNTIFDTLHYLESISDLRTIWEPNDTLRKQAILNEVNRHNEIININIHGRTNYQSVSASSGIVPEDIQRTVSNALLVRLESCYGASLVSQYLFSGDTMVVDAWDGFVLSRQSHNGVGIGEYARIMLMGKGVGYYAAATKQPGPLFGDPTFIYRSVPQGPLPWVNKKTITVDLGVQSFESLSYPAPVIGHFNFENQGDAMLLVSNNGTYSQTLNGQTWDKIFPNVSKTEAYALETVSPISPKLNSSFFVEVLPHSSTQQNVVAYICNSATSQCPAVKGQHQIKTQYSTNDPYNPFVDVIINYEVQ